MTLTLLRGFALRSLGREVVLAQAAQRLVAFLALRSDPVHRLHVAGVLWIHATEKHASASLRSTLWRLNRAAAGLVVAEGPRLALDPDVRVDLREATERARALIERPHEHERGDLELLRGVGDLLPDWYDDWVLIERERFRQLRLHALEGLCETLVTEGRMGEAADAGLAAVCGDPLRESAHRALISVHLAEGNASEALRQYSLCRRMLNEHLDMSPSLSMQRLMAAAQLQY
jgi:DNA-binding SARP family transcriptional activator